MAVWLRLLLGVGVLAAILERLLPRAAAEVEVVLVGSARVVLPSWIGALVLSLRKGFDTATRVLGELLKLGYP